MTEREKIIENLEYHIHLLYDVMPHVSRDDREYLEATAKTMSDTSILLKMQELVEANCEHRCNKCKFYEGVYNVMGHAPCSLWKIGGVMWNDYCSRFSAIYG